MASHGCTPASGSKEEIAELMPYMNLGKSGLRVSKLSFGAWVTFGLQVRLKLTQTSDLIKFTAPSLQVDVEQAFELMKVAYENGVNFFDNASVTELCGSLPQIIFVCPVKLTEKEKLKKSWAPLFSLAFSEESGSATIWL